MKGDRGIGVGATFAEVFLASTSSQLDEKVADLLYRRGPDQPSSSSLARRVRVQPLLLSLLLFVRGVRGHRRLDLFKGPGPYCGAEGRWRIVALTGSASV